MRRSRSILRWVAFCVPFLAVAVLASPVWASPVIETHPFISELGGSPPQPEGGGFEDACGVALDSNGDRYVADYFHDAIDIYSSEGGYVTQIAAESAGNGPCGMAVDNDPSSSSYGDLYVNNWRHEVVRLTPSSYPPGSETTYSGRTVIDPGPASGVAVGPNGDVYIDDGTHVDEYEPSGTQIAEIGLGTLEEGFGIAVSAFPATEGDVYVPDAATDTVKVFDPAGHPLPAIDGHGTPQAGFAFLGESTLAVDPTDGHVFILDNIGNGQSEHPEAVIDEFDAAGDYRGQIARWITHPEGAPGVSVEHRLTDGEPSGLAVGPTGDVYVTSGNFEAGEVSGLDKNGKKMEYSRLYEFGATNHAYTLMLTKTGSGVGTVTSNPAGINCGTACAAEYNATGERVVLTATPDSHSTFKGWSGSGCSGTGTCTVGMNEARSVSAEFEEIPQKTLTVTKVGEGTVTSGPTGIECGSACSEHFNEASTVTLKATPAIHNHLVAWSGCSSEPNPDECDVTMGAAESVHAEFAPTPQQTLSVEASGEGTLTSVPAGIECGISCTEHFDAEGPESTVILSAVPGRHEEVIWSGCEAQPSQNECEVTMSEARSVKAAFVPIHHRLSVNVVGEGSVSASSGAVSGCTATAGTCTGSYEEVETFTLVATPAAGSSFAGWSGGCGGTGPCHLTLGADTAVTANFAANPPPPVELSFPAQLTPGQLTVKGATAAFKVTASGPGDVLASGKGLKPLSVHTSNGGTLTLHLALSPSGSRAFSKAKELKIKVTLTFTPSDGSAPAFVTRVVTFKVRKGR